VWEFRERARASVFFACRKKAGKKKKITKPTSVVSKRNPLPEFAY
jgi:hypothetical protein